MVELTKWKKITVIQRDKELGCIPAGFEWLIRYVAIKGSFLDTFQEEFNLQRKGICENNFENISRSVNNRYQNINIKTKNFENGSEKLEFIKNLIKKDNPCLLSLAKNPRGGWHIMPVVFVDDKKIKCKNGTEILEFEISEVINRHDNWPGGKDIAWLEK